MRNLSISLAVTAVVVLACSSAPAGWGYVAGVRVVTPAPVVYGYSTITPVYAYPAYTYPVGAYPVAAYYSPSVISSSVVVGSRAYIPRRTMRRTVWTAW